MSNNPDDKNEKPRRLPVANAPDSLINVCFFQMAVKAFNHYDESENPKGFEDYNWISEIRSDVAALEDQVAELHNTRRSENRSFTDAELVKLAFLDEHIQTARDAAIVIGAAVS